MPFLFRVVYASKDHSYPRLPKREYMRALRKYGKYATHVNGNPARPSTLYRILERCPNVKDLICWDHVPIKEPEELAALRQLRRLSTSLGYMIADQINCSSTYANVTHLNLINTEDWELIFEFKNLTHLCFSHVTPIGDSREMFDTILQGDGGSQPRCRSLSVLISTTAHQIQFSPYEDPRESRYVLLQGEEGFVNDWARNVNGELAMDLWEFAERITVARRRGYLIDGSKTIIRSTFDFQKDLDVVGQLWWYQRNHTLEDTAIGL
ncbi:hypothetical protein BJ165DRAFT_231396 [Panaeolus papilionaceus]|nr:hypothetical protein BJ165DRAFT_231396 [Panaeolus papilionaceus]